MATAAAAASAGGRRLSNLADSVDAVETLLDADPFWALRVIQKREIVEWTVSLGSLGLDSER